MLEAPTFIHDDIIIIQIVGLIDASAFNMGDKNGDRSSPLQKSKCFMSYDYLGKSWCEIRLPIHSQRRHVIHLPTSPSLMVVAL